MLPCPKDPNFKMPDTPEQKYLTGGKNEDEELLQSGAWDGEEGDDAILGDEKLSTDQLPE